MLEVSVLCLCLFSVNEKDSYFIRLMRNNPEPNCHPLSKKKALIQQDYLISIDFIKFSSGEIYIHFCAIRYRVAKYQRRFARYVRGIVLAIHWLLFLHVPSIWPL